MPRIIISAIAAMFVTACGDGPSNPLAGRHEGEPFLCSWAREHCEELGYEPETSDEWCLREHAVWLSVAEGEGSITAQCRPGDVYAVQIATPDALEHFDHVTGELLGIEAARW